MPVSFTTLQIYDHYLTTYRNRDNSTEQNNSKSNRRSRYATHDTSELQNVYSSIQWKNRFAPLYLTEPTPESIAYAVHLKESADSLKQTIGALSGDTDDMFSMKSAYSDNETIASVEYVAEDAEEDTPADFELKIENFASPQVNTGKYLRSNQPVSLEPDSYSFDLLTNKLHYELQFNVNEGETNSDLQNKLARLINDSDLGVSARVLETHGRSALEITSEACGMPYQGERHFNIADENTSYSKGVVDYLGLNKSVKEATNAVYTINGTEESSYSNSFKVHGAYHVTLHPENMASSAGSDNMTALTAAMNTDTDSGIKIGLYPDTESLSNNIETFVDGYNHFLNGVLGPETDEPLTRLLSNDLHKFLNVHSASLEKYGISVNDDASLDYEKSDEITDADAIKGFGANILRKLNAISLDPMEYIDRRICAYPNPYATYPNPYVTSIYTGMLFNTYT
jgi:flagellar hook-associated protein 2